VESRAGGRGGNDRKTASFGGANDNGDGGSHSQGSGGRGGGGGGGSGPAPGTRVVLAGLRAADMNGLWAGLRPLLRLTSSFVFSVSVFLLEVIHEATH
jgi:hypothetical protein